MKDLVTNRLIIRSFFETDVDGLFEYLSMPRVNCFLDDKITTLEEAKQKVKERCQDEWCAAVTLRDTGELIGELFFHPEERYIQNGQEADTYNVGWNFNGRFEGKGFASESAHALFDYLFMDKNARRLYAFVEDDNIKSQALSERLGMRKEGCFVEFVSFINHPDGMPKYENTLQYAILKKEWLLRNN
ncbi:GNAT family N-acetyltransferase [Marinomonas spartinae]|uniref:GNAT family N-acetyltransferase n=1 Tax=Marinomonas spartinae TaxID=1792290 RepID=UPI0018F25D94|nr:GNAT family protein [Marinomonas spartinae]MBJ7556821.1 GNAT family N-acetyltransferase [Marinomonas spartinae]